MNNSNIILACKNLCKTYQEADKQTQILNNVSFTINNKELVAIVGKSGSGKSTLLHLLGGLDQPTSGEVYIKDQNLATLSSDQLAKLRNKHLGFVYQFHHLMADFTALENVMMPLLIANRNKNEAIDLAEQMLTNVGLSKRIGHKPSALSGGERQRVAIARSLINNPDIVLADEPTGNLDQKTTQSIFELIKELNQQQGITFLLVTHDLNLADKLTRKIFIEDGKII